MAISIWKSMRRTKLRKKADISLEKYQRKETERKGDINLKNYKMNEAEKKCDINLEKDERSVTLEKKAITTSK